MKVELIIGGIILLVLVGGLGWFLTTDSKGDLSLKGGDFPMYQEIVNPAGFVNTAPLTLKELVGQKVILIDFVTYSCINCQRTFPYLNAWYEKYQSDGLEIIAIHTPEFAFEKDIENVKRAMEEFGIKFPVVLDNNYDTWNAYQNKYWPRKYLINIDGQIVYDHIGEGAYEETERKIQELLVERSKKLGLAEVLKSDLVADDILSSASTKVDTPEIYFGFLRNDLLANGLAGKGGVQTFSLPTEVKKNLLYLKGKWSITDEFAENLGVGDEVVIKYQAEKVYMVGRSTKPVQMEVWLDGQLVEAKFAGEEVKSGIVTIDQDKLYNLIKNTTGSHLLRLKILSPGMQAFTFTFG